MASTRTMDFRVQPTADAFIRFLEQHGVRVTVTSARRDASEQRKLYDCYRRTGCSNCRRGPGCFPAAPPGRSTHDRGIAMDLHLDPPVYSQAGAIWKRLGFTWGGDFDDPIHFDFRRRA
jgi:hypothetical protein